MTTITALYPLLEKAVPLGYNSLVTGVLPYYQTRIFGIMPITHDL